MNRSEINYAVRSAINFFERHGWVLPPNPAWDVTDFGLGIFRKEGLVLVNLAAEPEYCEKLMYAWRDQTTPAHYHKQKKEDIICRVGELAVTLWGEDPETIGQEFINVKINGEYRAVRNGEPTVLKAGERITITPLLWHAFHPVSAECIIGEVSTANDDENDNFFWDKEIGRFPEIVEDEPPLVKLLSE
ncbi:D-lyxose/D-mannose family sugar isomerase [Parapedobacter sp. GCM10030251]|jgi:ABC-type sugar transport system, auxiliary component|uniref:D-lyxose/D-mannose family sugar isomerase n=1 Tax=Parapedobacter sp. GCM10030251 TaxID=3273419 RepID=UPI00361B26D0